MKKKILTVSSILYLQEQFKQQTGVEYKPGMAPPASTPAPSTSSSDSTSCPYSRVVQQGELVRKLKAEQAPKVKGIFQSIVTSSSVCQIFVLCPTLFVRSFFVSHLISAEFVRQKSLVWSFPCDVPQHLSSDRSTSSCHLHDSQAYSEIPITIRSLLMVPGPD